MTELLRIDPDCGIITVRSRHRPSIKFTGVPFDSDRKPTHRAIAAMNAAIKADPTRDVAEFHWNGNEFEVVRDRDREREAVAHIITLRRRRRQAKA